MVSKEKNRPLFCLTCSHEIKLINNDEDFSWDMHKQEQIHKNSFSKKNQSMGEKADSHMCIKHMKKFFASNSSIEERVENLIRLANKELQNTERNEKVIRAVAGIFFKVYPAEFTVRPFGSRITGLTTSEHGDLDLFIDTSSADRNITLVESPELENHYLRRLADYMEQEKEKEGIWVNINKVLSCRTPILKVLHYDTKMQCDITVMNALGNVNTQLMSMYINNISKFRPLILMIREWSSECDFVKEINNYALSLLVLFYLQQDKYAPPVCTFEFDYRQPTIKISGFDCLDYNLVDYDWSTVKSTDNVELKDLLFGFFSLYANYDFDNNVICPLLSKSLKKKLFTPDGKKLPSEMNCYIQKLRNRGEVFRINDKGMNLQDPIDLAHNLTKSTSGSFVKCFADMCDSAKRALEMIN